MEEKIVQKKGLSPDFVRSLSVHLLARPTFSDLVSHLLLLEEVVQDERGGPLGVVGVLDALSLAQRLPVAGAPEKENYEKGSRRFLSPTQPKMINFFICILYTSTLCRRRRPDLSGRTGRGLANFCSRGDTI